MSAITQFFGGGSVASAAQAQQAPSASGLKFQTSVYGGAIPLIWGATKVSVNFIGYGGFKAVANPNAPAGGKGGSSGSQSGSTGYSYSAGFMLGVCEGPISGFGKVYLSSAVKATTTAAGLTAFTGTYPQSPWVNRGKLQAVMATDGMGGYNGLAYLAQAARPLGSSPSPPNFNVEVFGFRYSFGSPDADPSDIIPDMFTSLTYGAGFPAANVDATTRANYSNYAVAAGLLFSPAYINQDTAANMAANLLLLSNTDAVISEGNLKFLPRGDTAMGSYTPPAAPAWAFTADDFVVTSDEDPVSIDRKDPSDLINSVTLECLDRANKYNPITIKKEDANSIAVIGRRDLPSQQAHEIALPSIAGIAAQLLLQRQSIMNTYSWTTDERFFWLDPGDIVSLTETVVQNLSGIWVRILTMDEDDSGNWKFTAEDYSLGTGSVGAVSDAGGSGTAPDTDVDPGQVNNYLFFEPPALFTQGALQVGIAAAGYDDNYGGCEIWIASDNNTFTKAGVIAGSSRVGNVIELSGIPAVQAFPVPPTTQPNTQQYSVEVVGLLQSVSSSDWLALNTACFFDDGTNSGIGEVIAYQNATLTLSGSTVNDYDLDTLIRGAYNSTIMAHPYLSKFTRMDNSVALLDFSQDRIGQTLYVKLLAFNIYGNAVQDLSAVTSHAYVVKGTSLLAPIDNGNTVALTEINNLKSLVGGIQIQVSRLQKTQLLITDQGNSWTDGFSTSTGIDTVHSINATPNPTLGTFTPAVAVAGLIPQATGTRIGSGLQLIFDGVKSKKAAVADTRSVLQNSGEVLWFGKDYGLSPKVLSKGVFYGSVDRGWGNLNTEFSNYPVNNGANTMQPWRLRLYGSNVAPTRGDDGQLLAGPQGTGPTGQSATSPDPFKYVWSAPNVSAGFAVAPYPVSSAAFRYLWGTIEASWPGLISPKVSIAQFELYQGATPSNMSLLSKFIAAGSAISNVQLQTQIDVTPEVILNVNYKIFIAADAVQVPGKINGVTIGLNPTVTMSVAHNLVTGQTVRICLVVGAMASVLNGLRTVVTVLSPTTFSIVANTTGLTFTASPSSSVLKASFQQIQMTDVTQSPGKSRAIQSADTPVAVPGTQLVYLIETSNAISVATKGINITWR